MSCSIVDRVAFLFWAEKYRLIGGILGFILLSHGYNSVHVGIHLGYSFIIATFMGLWPQHVGSCITAGAYTPTIIRTFLG
ncbi:hypothetical protein [Sporomusa aerivorans]|uniref:hypothetical protein n=1 Tax=Sporomusa aerivorans TaxID=204936 RepID=UPI003529E691